MSNEVYANGQEVSCKAAAGKSIAAFPDVCFTPPLTPATPPGVPIPYPNTGMASDTSGGSKTVQISGKEVMMKDSSYFKTSTGDEAGSAPKKNVITSVNKGKCYYTAWSMDVKIEGENAVRHLDMMTHNHACSPGATPPWVYVDAAAMSDDCKKAVQEKNDCMEKHTKNNITQAAREKHKKPGVSAAKAKASAVGDKSLVDWDALLQDPDVAPQAAVQRDFCKDPKCKDKLECALIPYSGFCCPAPEEATPTTPKIESKTPHHVVQAHCFIEVGGRSEGEGKTYAHVDKYKHTEAPCICLDGGGKVKEHGDVHKIADKAEQDVMPKTAKMGKTKQLTKGGELQWDRTPGTWTFAEANDSGCDAVTQVKTGCDKECLKQQSEAAHKNMMGDQISPTTPLRADPFGTAPPGFVPGGAAPATTVAPS